MFGTKYRSAVSIVLLVAALLLIFQSLPAASAQNSTSISTQNMIKPIKYPNTKKIEQIDDYHGTKVSDPYRWLEDLDSPETARWVEDENNLAFSFLNEIPARNLLKDRLTKLWNYEKFGVPFKEGNRYFYSRNSGLQNQSVIYTVTALNAQPQVLIDPNTLSTDGTVALSGLSVSDNGKLMAYSLSASGSDWQEWKVRDIDSGKDLADDIKWVKFSGASWTGDNKGFFYSRYDEPKSDALKGTNYFQKLYYHRLGTTQSEDVLIYDRPDQKDWFFDGYVTEDGHYLVITVSQGTDVKNRIYYKDLVEKEAPVVKLLDDYDSSYKLIVNE
jgi:prolyl oligopeptidase